MRTGRSDAAQELRSREDGGLSARPGFHNVDVGLFSRGDRVCARVRKAGVVDEFGNVGESGCLRTAVRLSGVRAAASGKVLRL